MESKGRILKKIGRQLQDISLQIQNMGMQISNIDQYFGLQIQNISLQISNIAMKIFNIGIQIPDSNQMKENFGIQNFNIPNQEQKINIFAHMNNIELNNNNFNNNINNIDYLPDDKIISIYFHNSKGQVHVITVKNEVIC